MPVLALLLSPTLVVLAVLLFVIAIHENKLKGDKAVVVAVLISAFCGLLTFWLMLSGVIK